MPSTKKNKIGKVFLIGAGPGDPGLITVRGLQLISQADVLFYDNLVNSKILSSVPSNVELIYVGKRGEGKSSEQKEIEEQIVSAAKKGKWVVRLKGGDPFIFGRGGEEAERLAEEKIPYEIVPGVTSPIAVPAYAGIPLTHRDFTSTVVFVTGHAKELGAGDRGIGVQNTPNSKPLTPDQDNEERSSTDSLNWSALAKMGTLVFVMGVKTIRQNMQQLIKAGRNPQEPCALIRWGTYPKQKTWISTISEIAAVIEKEKIMPPAILVVGKVVKLRDKINWFETKPLFGKKIVVTRAIPLSEFSSREIVERKESLATQLSELGADVIQIPTIEIHPPRSFKPLDTSIRQIEKYDWIVFTSVHGIHFFFERFKALKKDFRSLAKCKIAVVGSMSAKALEAFGFKADLIPKKFNSDALGISFSKLPLKNKNFLLVQAKDGKKEWSEILKSKKAKVEIVEAYQNRPPARPLPSPLLCKEGEKKNSPLFTKERGWGRGPEESSIDLITFTSSSTVKNFYQMIQPSLKEKILEIPSVCIGSTTAKTAKEFGFRKIILANRATLDGMVEKIICCLEK